MKNIFAFAGGLLFVATAAAQTAPIEIRVVYDATDASSSAVTPLLIQKIRDNPKVFILAKDDDKNMSVIADCYRETPDDPYSCFYTASKLPSSTQSFLGGAIVVKKTAEEAATALFGSIVQDVAERWNSTERHWTCNIVTSCRRVSAGCTWWSLILKRHSRRIAFSAGTIPRPAGVVSRW